MSSTCLDCGACCACFRVSFYWAEAGDENGVPEGLTEKLTPHLLAMRGTNEKQPRCLALQGQVGERAGCSIYEQRPSPCREFEAGSDRCLNARLRHGLDDAFPGEVVASI